MAASIRRQQIGRYEIVGSLAVGGMAEIKLARIQGPSGFERPVVIKQILPHLSRLDEFVNMFLDEARIIAGIRHVNVVQVHELGQHDGELFLVMEYLEGEGTGSLLRRMRRLDRKLELGIAAYVVAEACAGLHAAHELTDVNGRKLCVVHRDMSPQNLFITYSGGVKVLDFGIAKAADRITKTEVGQIKGKYEYMSPEQSLGKKLDRRSDIFSLGTVLYELMTLRKPFRRDTSLMTFRAICEEPIGSLGKALERCPAKVARICMRALSRDPDDRYQRAADMRNDLMEFAGEICRVHTLGDDLSRLMHDLFADRIEEKAEMLRRVRAGSVITYLPAAEVDVAMDLVTETDLGTGATSGGVEVAPSQKRPVKRIVLGIGGATCALGAVLWWYWPRDEVQPPAVVEVPTKSSEQHVAAPPPASITIVITSAPEGADVFIDGLQLGTTPTSIPIARGTEATTVELRKDGFATLSERVLPDVDQRIRVTLAPKATKPVSQAVPNAKKPATKPAQSSFFRFD